MKRQKVKPISLESLRLSRGFKSLESFCAKYEKVTGERLPDSTMSAYELEGCRISTRRLKNMTKVLKLTPDEVKGLEAFFKDHKKPLRHVAQHPKHKNKHPKSGVRKKPQTRMLRREGTGARKATTKKVVTGIIPGMNEAGNFLILCKERAQLLGDKINDIAVLTAIFMEANGVKTK